MTPTRQKRPGVSYDKIMRVWEVASRLYAVGANITTRKVAREAGLSSSSIAAAALRHLVRLGYMRRGPGITKATWAVDIPFSYYTCQETSNNSSE